MTRYDQINLQRNCLTITLKAVVIRLEETRRKMETDGEALTVSKSRQVSRFDKQFKRIMSYNFGARTLFELRPIRNLRNIDETPVFYLSLANTL